MFGADEAGRGPVLGSLFIGFVDAPVEDLPSGVADSKTLSSERITELAETLYDAQGVNTAVVEVTPQEIDAEDANVTRLTAAAMAEAISDAAVSDDGVVDACHPDPVVFADMVTAHVTREDSPTVNAQHEADLEVPQVMAASIIAKYEREQQIAELRDDHGAIGSGYPSDPDTQTFLQSYVETYGELPGFARRSWQTSRDAVTAAKQRHLDEFAERPDA